MAMTSAAAAPATRNQRLAYSPNRVISRSRTSVRRLSLGLAVSTRSRPVIDATIEAPVVHSSTGTYGTRATGPLSTCPRMIAR